MEEKIKIVMGYIKNSKGTGYEQRQAVMDLCNQDGKMANDVYFEARRRIAVEDMPELADITDEQRDDIKRLGRLIGVGGSMWKR